PPRPHQDLRRPADRPARPRPRTRRRRPAPTPAPQMARRPRAERATPEGREWLGNADLSNGGAGGEKARLRTKDEGPRTKDCLDWSFVLGLRLVPHSTARNASTQSSVNTADSGSSFRIDWQRRANAAWRWRGVTVVKRAPSRSMSQASR